MPTGGRPRGCPAEETPARRATHRACHHTVRGVPATFNRKCEWEEERVGRRLRRNDSYCLNSVLPWAVRAAVAPQKQAAPSSHRLACAPLALPVLQPVLRLLTRACPPTLTHDRSKRLLQAHAAEFKLLVADFTPNYLCDPEAMRRLHRMSARPDALRFIVLMREPAKRALSEWSSARR